MDISPYVSNLWLALCVTLVFVGIHKYTEYECNKNTLPYVYEGDIFHKIVKNENPFLLNYYTEIIRVYEVQENLTGEQWARYEIQFYCDTHTKSIVVESTVKTLMALLAEANTVLVYRNAEEAR